MANGEQLMATSTLFMGLHLQRVHTVYCVFMENIVFLKCPAHIFYLNSGIPAKNTIFRDRFHERCDILTNNTLQITLFPSFGRKVKQKKKKLPIIYYHSKATLFNHNTITFTKFTNIPNSSCSIPKKKKNKLFSPRIYYAWKISSPPRILPSQIKFPPIPGIRLNQEFVLLGEQNKVSCFENRGTIERERMRERGEKERGGRKARVRQLAD